MREYSQTTAAATVQSASYQQSQQDHDKLRRMFVRYDPSASRANNPRYPGSFMASSSKERMCVGGSNAVPDEETDVYVPRPGRYGAPGMFDVDIISGGDSTSHPVSQSLTPQQQQQQLHWIKSPSSSSADSTSAAVAASSSSSSSSSSINRCAAAAGAPLTAGQCVNQYQHYHHQQQQQQQQPIIYHYYKQHPQQQQPPTHYSNHQHQIDSASIMDRYDQHRCSSDDRQRVIGGIQQPLATSSSNDGFEFRMDDFPSLDSSTSYEMKGQSTSALHQHHCSSHYYSHHQYRPHSRSEQHELASGIGSIVDSPSTDFGTAALVDMSGAVSTSAPSKKTPGPRSPFPGFALDLDLTKLGIKINQTDVLYKGFNSPFDYNSGSLHRTDHAVPPEYLLYKCTRSRLCPVNLALYQEDVLFFLYYNLCEDYLQPLAARELMRRGWIYFKPEQTWISRLPDGEPSSKTQTYEYGTFLVFDHKSWRKIKKEIYVDLENIECDNIDVPTDPLLPRSSLSMGVNDDCEKPSTRIPLNLGLNVRNTFKLDEPVIRFPPPAITNQMRTSTINNQATLSQLTTVPPPPPQLPLITTLSQQQTTHMF